MKKMFLSFAFLTLFAASSFAADPFKLSLWDKFAIPQSEDALIEFGIGSNTQNIGALALNWLYSQTNTLVGAQIGIVNFNYEKVSGAQVGFFNKAKYVKGAQVGVVNMTEDIYGVQVGVINHIQNSKLPWMVFFNAKF